MQLHAQASSLYCSATQVSARPTDGAFYAVLRPSPLESRALDLATYHITLGELSGRLTAFWQNLPSLDTVQDVEQHLRSRLLLIHVLVYCAIIQLHGPLEPRGAMCIATNSQAFLAAYNAANMLNQTGTRALTFIDPILGVCARTVSNVGSESDIFDTLQSMLVSVAGVLIDGLRFLRRRASTTLIPTDAEEQSILAALVQIRSAMKTWSARSAYMSTWKDSSESHMNVGLMVTP